MTGVPPPRDGVLSHLFGGFSPQKVSEKIQFGVLLTPINAADPSPPGSREGKGTVSLAAEWPRTGLFL